MPLADLESMDEYDYIKSLAKPKLKEEELELVPFASRFVQFCLSSINLFSEAQISNVTNKLSIDFKDNGITNTTLQHWSTLTIINNSMKSAVSVMHTFAKWGI